MRVAWKAVTGPKQLARAEGEATWSEGRDKLVAFWVREVQDNGIGRSSAFSFPGFHAARVLRTP